MTVAVAYRRMVAVGGRMAVAGGTDGDVPWRCIDGYILRHFRPSCLLLGSSGATTATTDDVMMVMTLAQVHVLYPLDEAVR